MDGTIGTVIMFAGNFAPRNWAFCDGQLLSINQNQALFSIIGTIYGGDGRTTFALPDLRGRTPIGPRQGAGLSNYREGQKGGVETVTLNTTQIPSHNHTAALSNVTGTVNATLEKGVGKGATGGYISANNEFKPNGGGGDISGLNVNISSLNANVSVGLTGGNQPHENRQPWLAINYIICTQGMFPSRN